MTKLGGWSATCDRAFAPWAKAGFEAGRVALEHRGAYRLLTLNGELTAAVAGQFRHQAEDSQTFPAVGDWVVMQRQDEGAHAIIHGVLPARASLCARRRAAKPRGSLHGRRGASSVVGKALVTYPLYTSNVS